MATAFAGIKESIALSKGKAIQVDATSDEALISRARNGDQRAFRELVERYQQQVAATVIGMLGPGDVAEDVGQNTFIQLYRSLNRFRGDSALGTYLTRIAINLSLNELKRRRRWHEVFTRPEEIELSDESVSADYADDAELIQMALKQLKPSFRAVVNLRLLQEYSTKETAEILDLPLGTVLSRLARAQTKLKTILAPYLKDDEENTP